MVAQLIWIAAVYVSAAVIIHMLHNREQKRQSPRVVKWIHYILITRNHESVVEWYIRALTFHGECASPVTYIFSLDPLRFDSHPLLPAITIKGSGTGCPDIRKSTTIP